MRSGKVVSLVVVSSLSALLTVGVGCASAPPRPVGFLSDYSKLKPDGSNLRFVDESAVSRYDKFIVDPVTIHFHKGAKGIETDSESMREITDRMRSAIESVLRGRYSIVSRPGPGVARLRVAITDVKSDTAAMNILPPMRLSGVGFGGASMEAELVDSRSGAQIGAVIQTQKGSAISLQGFSEWSSADAVIDAWAKRFRASHDSV